MTLKPVFKTSTQSSVISKWVIENFPENYEDMTYIEPYGGATNVLINKNKSLIEIFNDIDLSVVKIYQAIRDEPIEYLKRLQKQKFNHETFSKAINQIKTDDYLDAAVNEYIARRMSKNGCKQIFILGKKPKKITKQDMKFWNTSLEELEILAERLKEVYVFNKNAIDVIDAFDGNTTLIYCDPPQLYETHVSKKVYISDMSTDEHIQLAHSLNKSSCKIILRGRNSPLYKRLYKDWNVAKVTNLQQKKIKEKKELLWKNF